MKHTVLIVDDVPENLQVVSGILHHEGVNIAMAQSGEEALRAVAHKTPDLILLDIMMPGMDGFDVCQALHTNPETSAIPVIFLTGRGNPEDILRGFHTGAVDYITKPFHPQEVKARVFTHLELKHARDLILQQNRRLTEQNTELEQQSHELNEFHELKEHHLSETIKQSEEQYRLLVENVADGIGIIQDKTVVFVNNALAVMLGRQAQQLIGHSPAELFQHNYEEQYHILESQQRGESHTTRHWPVLQCITTWDNQEIWLEGTQSTIVWKGRPAILIDLRDITARKTREMAIEAERNNLRRENLQLKSSIKDRYRFGEIIGKSQAMQQVYDLVLRAADSDKDVLICGESGTGKELIARTIHAISSRQKNPFVPVNCGAIQETLFESEFFGHRKGAFTGADRNKQGFFDAAHQGILFLDEVGELTPTMQVKLLRAIEGGEYTPVGENTPKTVNTRIIAATNRDLRRQVTQGTMREDFFYRIHVIVITLPPLRKRKEDIPLLIDYFLKQTCGDDDPPSLSGEILEALYKYDWPGNIRQLHNVLSRYLAVGTLDFIGHRSEKPSPEKPSTEKAALEGDDVKLSRAVARLEEQLIRRALRKYRWHRIKTAASLGIPRKTLFRKMQKYGIK